MGNDLVVKDGGMINSFGDVERIGKAMASSGYFKDAMQAAQAAVKILAGQEMGIGPFASMTGIHVIKGKPSIGANLMASAVKAHPKYDYRVKQIDNAGCVIMFYENGEELGESSFSAQDAKAAGTQNLGKFPRNMLFARAMSNGIKWFCPDVFVGNTVYTPDELGGISDTSKPELSTRATGEIVDVTPPAAEVITGEIVEDEAPAASVCPRVFNSVADAVQWALASGAFTHPNHAMNAYEKVKREGSPQNAAEMAVLWCADIDRRRVENMREASAPLAEFLKNATLEQKRGRASSVWSKLKKAGLAESIGSYTDDVDEWLLTAETALDSE